MRPRIVLAYSGGFTATSAIPWLVETAGADVVAVTLDLGQLDNLVEVRDRALAAGALRCHVLDARDVFAGRHVLPSLKAQALADGAFPMATALGRPLIAEKLVEVARLEQATRVAHGGSGHDRIRLDGPIHDLDAGLGVMAVADAWGFSPEQLAEYADRHGIPGAAGPGSTRTERTLWGQTSSYQSDDAWQEPPEQLYTLTKAIEHAPTDPAFVEITFERGGPVEINGVPMRIVELIESLTTIAGEHGIGRLQRLTLAADGRSHCEVYEAPAAVVLHQAHADLASFVAAGRLRRVAESVARAYADVLDIGEWHSPLRRALDGFVDRAAEPVSGTVRLKFFKAACRVVGRSSHAAPAATETTV